MSQRVSKDADEIKDYVRDWKPGMPAGDTIAASTWIIPEGLTKLETPPRVSSFTDTTTTVWLSGGTTGQSYDCVNRVQTTGGRVYDRTLRVGIVAT